MKKTFVLAVVLLLMSAVVVTVFASYVTLQEKAVTIDELTLYGDRSAAEGLAFATNTELSDQLFWDVEYNIGRDEISKLDYSYYDSPQSSSMRVSESGVILYTDEIEIGVGASGVNLSLEYSSQYVRDVAERTPDGEYREEVITVSDYYEYLPLRFDYYNIRSSSTGMYPAMEYVDRQPHLNEYFKIPVPKDLQVVVGVTKSDHGTVTGYDTQLADDEKNGYPYFEIYTAAGDDCAYFAFNLSYEGVGAADYSEIEDGYGIYKIPFYPEPEAAAVPMGSDLEMVYPIDPSTQRLMSLAANESKDKMLLITLEADGYYLTVLDMEDASQLQKLRILDEETEREDGYRAIYFTNDEGMFLFRHTEGAFAFVMENETGEYEAVMHGSIDDLEETANFYWRNMDRTGLAYRDGRLALATTVDYYGVDTAVAVFENGQLVYVGVFDYSGMTGRSIERRDYHAALTTPIDVWFE